MLESIPPALVPVVVAVVASVIGALLWRLFKLALKVVAFIVFLIICVGMVAWWQPALFGMGKQVVEERIVPVVEDAKSRATEHVQNEIKKELRKELDAQTQNPHMPADTP